MEGQRERTGGRRRQRRKSKAARGKVVVEPVLIAARRPDSPRLENGLRNVVASAQPKSVRLTASPGPVDGRPPIRNGGTNGHGLTAEAARGSASTSGHTFNAPDIDAHGNGNGHGHYGVDADVGSNGVEDGFSPSDGPAANGSASSSGAPLRRRTARIVKVAEKAMAPGHREQQLLDRLVHSQGRGAISRAADDLWESKIVVPKRQEIQIQLLEHENEQRARDAVFAMAELLQREAPIKRPLLDQRLRRLETSAEDPITRDAAGALRRSMRVHHGL